MKIEYIDPRELIPYEKNAKIHDKSFATNGEQKLGAASLELRAIRF